MKRFTLPLLIAAVPAFAQSTEKTSCFPENNLHLEDRLDRKDANIDEVIFNDVITKVISYYGPIVSSHNAELTVERNWDDATVNAYAQQSGSTWSVAMFGGLARRPEVTADGFAMVVCHEVGHHLAGFPFYDEGWAASEGQSDYFATQTCASNIWKDDLVENATHRETAPTIVREKCDASYSEMDRQNLCYRTVMGGKSLGELLAALGSQEVPQLETPDTNVVADTVTSHPAGQCRLDTYFNGALCSNLFDEMLIPGRNNEDGQGSISAERIAALKSCTDAAFYSFGKRPKCWYSPKLALTVDASGITKTEVIGNGNDVWEPGETFAINVPLVNNLLSDVEGATLTITEAVNAIRTDYPTIEAGETAYAIEPVQIGTPRSRQCGEQFSLLAKVEVGTWSNESTLDFVLGENPQEERVEDNTAIDIPDADTTGIEKVIMGTSDKMTPKVNVAININHTYIGDLTIALSSPAGNTYTLHQNQGGQADNINKVFSVEVANEAIVGAWTLKVTDTARQDVGMLNSWAIDFTTISCEAGSTFAAVK